MDGVDAALLETDGEHLIQYRGHISLSYDPDFHTQLKYAEQAFYVQQSDNHDTAERYLQTHHKLSLNAIIQRSTEWHLKAVQELLTHTKHSPESIDIIGYHGQTLFHQPAQGITLQAGHSQYLANMLAIPVIGDFRKNDLKHGGQGAPFAPLYHQALAVRDKQYPIGIINCGGIANITLISGTRYEDILAFDTGPGNALIDRYLKSEIDRDGQYSLHGRIHTDVLAVLYERSTVRNSINYFTLPPPKSLDINDLQLIPEVLHLSKNDACATLAAFTAHTIADSLTYANQPLPRLWVLAGGGAKNPVILRELSNRLGTVKTADEMGWNAQAMEAELFAWLAVRSLKKLPLSIPQTTGVSELLTGGQIFMPE